MRNRIAPYPGPIRTIQHATPVITIAVATIVFIASRHFMMTATTFTTLICGISDVGKLAYCTQPLFVPWECLAAPLLAAMLIFGIGALTSVRLELPQYYCFFSMTGVRIRRMFNIWPGSLSGIENAMSKSLHYVGWFCVLVSVAGLLVVFIIPPLVGQL
jgi:hypothetical protein